MLTLFTVSFFVTLLGNILYSHMIHNVHGISWLICLNSSVAV